MADTQGSWLKDLLVALLQEAAEIEQQVMVQYLYAAFSLKKYPDRTCSPAQYESVRRWGSTLLAVARSEMEHLALVNGMLTAIGSQPYFDRRNIPHQVAYYLGQNLAEGRDRAQGTEPCDIPFYFERFNLATIERFVCIESPDKKTLVENGLPVPHWCFSCEDERYSSTSRADWTGDQETRVGRSRPPLLYPLAESRVPPELWERTKTELAEARGLARSAAAEELKPGTIQELYDLIEALFVFLSARGNLFTGNPAQQVFVPVEYQINIFPITDLASTKMAIRQIVEEGEGADAPPDYQSHFTRFFRVRDELKAHLEKDPRFEPSLPLPLNPERSEITDEFARELFDLFNDSYATLVFMLTSLYRNFAPESSYPFLATALQESVFGPMMTMLIRPLAEVMAYTRSGDGAHTTGPNYHLSEADRKLLQNPAAPELGDVDFFLRLLDEIVSRLDRLSAGSTDERLAGAAREAEDVPFLSRQLRFVFESATALTNNLRRIYQIGQLPQFVVAPSP